MPSLTAVRYQLYERISTAEKILKVTTDKDRLIEGKIEGYKDCLRMTETRARQDRWECKAVASITKRHTCKSIYIIGKTPTYGWIVANTVITGYYAVYITDIEFCPYCGEKLDVPGELS